MANATIRVQFGSATGGEPQGHLSAEIDSRPNGLNGGKTSFAPGESVYVLVYKTSNVSITETACSAGSFSSSGSATVTVEDEITFDGEDTASLSKPASSRSVSTEWMGRSLGSLSVQSDKMTVKAGSKGVAVAKVSYSASALVYRLSSPSSINGTTDFSVVALIKGTAS